MHPLVWIEAGLILLESNSLFVYSNLWPFHGFSITNHNSQQVSEKTEHPLIPNPPDSSIGRAQERFCILRMPVLFRPRRILLLAASFSFALHDLVRSGRWNLTVSWVLSPPTLPWLFLPQNTLSHNRSWRISYRHEWQILRVAQLEERKTIKHDLKSWGRLFDPGLGEYFFWLPHLLLSYSLRCRARSILFESRHPFGCSTSIPGLFMTFSCCKPHYLTAGFGELERPQSWILRVAQLEERKTINHSLESWGRLFNPGLGEDFCQLLELLLLSMVLWGAEYCPNVIFLSIMHPTIPGNTVSWSL